MSEMHNKPSEAADFWSMSYCGHEIAVQRHYSGWLVYLNQVMQHGMLFEDARSAANWLRRQVDQHTATAS